MMNSQLSKETNFEIVFRNLEHVLFCEISQKKFHLWIAVIGQSASVYKHRMKRRRCWLSKVYFQCETAYFRKKNSKFFFRNRIDEINVKRDWEILGQNSPGRTRLCIAMLDTISWLDKIGAVAGLDGVLTIVLVHADSNRSAQTCSTHYHTKYPTLIPPSHSCILCLQWMSGVV